MKRLISLFFFVGFAGFSPRSEAQVELRPEVEELRQNLESKVLRTLETYLGGRSRVLVSLRLKVTEPDAVPSVEGESVANLNSTWVDLGYVTTPGDGLAASSEKNRVQLAGTQVTVRVAEDLEDAVLQQVQQIATSALEGYNPDVRIEKVNFLEKAKDAAQENQPELDPLEKLLQKYGALVPLLAALVLGVGVLLAFGSISRVLNRSASEIAAGIRSMRPTVTSNPDKPLTVASASGDEDENGKGKAAKAPPVPPRLREHVRNLSLVKKMLEENPLPFVRSLGDEMEDVRGLRWLLTNLEDQQRTSLKKFLPLEMLEVLTQEPPESQESWDPTTWLQRTVENLVIREVAGASLVEKALDSELVLKLSSAEPAQLQNTALRLGDPAVWRVALEFLPKERVGDALKSMETSVWQTLFAGSELGVEELRRGAEKMAGELGQGEIPSSQQNAQQGDERRRFYSNILLDPALDAILTKALGEDDVFLDELAQMAPEFVTLVRKKIWTPRVLTRLEDAVLKEYFNNLSSPQKVAVLTALPQDLSVRLEAFMPEGTGRTIVLDQLRKARERNDAGEIESATRLTREFLDYLRAQAEEGRFVLKEEAPEADAPASESQAA